MTKNQKPRCIKQMSTEEAFQERPLGVLPSDTETYPREERKAVTTMSGLTLDGSFIPHSNFLRRPRPIPFTSYSYPSRLQEENFQALENPTGRADHFVYRIDIADDKFPIENNSLSGNPTPSSDLVVESLSPSHIPRGDSDSLVEETDILLSHFNDSLPDYKTLCFDIEEKSSGSTTSHSDLSLLEYGSFHFDLSIDPIPLADRSNSQHEEFADGLAHIISPPEYDLFYFDVEPDLGELTILCEKNISKDST
ncbi:hypothetical protein Tco_1160488 [Tanacetum coccineum]